MSDWINALEKLPEDRKEVAVYARGRIYKAFYVTGLNSFLENIYDEKRGPGSIQIYVDKDTYWSTLPEIINN